MRRPANSSGSPPPPPTRRSSSRRRSVITSAPRPRHPRQPAPRSSNTHPPPSTCTSLSRRQPGHRAQGAPSRRSPARACRTRLLTLGSPRARAAARSRTRLPLSPLAAARSHPPTCLPRHLLRAARLPRPRARPGRRRPSRAAGRPRARPGGSRRWTRPSSCLTGPAATSTIRQPRCVGLLCKGMPQEQKRLTRLPVLLRPRRSSARKPFTRSATTFRTK